MALWTGLHHLAEFDLNLEGIWAVWEKKVLEPHSCMLSKKKRNPNPALFHLVRSDVSTDDHLCGCSLDQCWSPAGQGHTWAKLFLSPRIGSEDQELPGLPAVVSLQFLQYWTESSTMIHTFTPLSALFLHVSTTCKVFQLLFPFLPVCSLRSHYRWICYFHLMLSHTYLLYIAFQVAWSSMCTTQRKSLSLHSPQDS